MGLTQLSQGPPTPTTHHPQPLTRKECSSNKVLMVKRSLIRIIVFEKLELIIFVSQGSTASLVYIRSRLVRLHPSHLRTQSLDWDPQYSKMGHPTPNFCLPDYTKYEIWNRGMTDILNSAELNLKVQPSNTKIRR